MWIRGAFLALGLALTAGLPTAAQAQSNLVFEIANESRRDVQIEFRSQDRDHYWPAPNKAYDIARGGVERYNLQCRRDEKICYGAWVKGNAKTYWGRGFDGKQSCDACCAYCGDGTVKKRLTLD